MRSRLYAVALVAAAYIPGLACAGQTATPSTAITPPSAPRPPASLPERLTAADAALRASLEEWRAADPTLLSTTPRASLVAAAKERSIVHVLTQNRALATRTLSALPSKLASAIGTDIRAARDLRLLTGASIGSRLRLVPPLPAGRLLGYYELAQTRFGVHWQVLAAVNLVESAFGRVTNHSSAGAQGPMQFLPSTWRAYGLGGDIHSSRDAILAAANYLHQSGAPADDRRALYAYNPSSLYVDAVLAYAQAMTRDPLAYLTYYTWQASLPS